MINRNSKILIALIKVPSDFKILDEEGWYRIPLAKTTPKSIKNMDLKYIAFYMGKNFKENGFKIQYYGKISNIQLMTRKELFPNEIENDKSDKLYYKISIDTLEKLDKPILSNRKRMVVFINSTLYNFQKAKEINDLFFESPIEEVLWKEFKVNKINAERQFHVKMKSRTYILDFALFCKQIKLGIECDGDKYHLEKKDVKADKKRDNDLKSKGWNILRYTTKELNYDTENVVRQIKETINYYGGLEQNDENYKYFPNQETSDQIGLFGVNEDKIE